MKVVRDFEEVYREQEDPWNIGKADVGRYSFYYEKILQLSDGKEAILDIGCGFGSFLSRFKNHFAKSVGIELSKTAIRKGEEKHPHIEFFQGSADRLQDFSAPFDVIIASDVICYLNEKGKRFHLKWIARHLSSEGLALIAGWTPGGKYLSHEEFKRLVLCDFKIEEEHLLESGHSAFFCRPKKSYIAITIDYETWHPIPEGEQIDWEKDIFEPFEEMIKLGVPLTFMAEMGEYFWLKKHMPSIAEKMEEQWKRAVQNGHDVQLHLHPNWLPELGARFEGGEWIWDWSKRKLCDYPGDLKQLIRTCKETLETLLKGVKTDYQVKAFRAGAYQVQPFSRIYEALVENEIFCDSSVFQGGISVERGYDFSFAYSNHLPYWANRYDPQLKAPPAESKLIEIPIYTFKRGARWSLDGVNAKSIASGVLRRKKDLSTEWFRIFRKIKEKIASKRLPRFLPEAFFEYITHYKEERLVGDDYFIMIGHTKGEHSFSEIDQNIKKLKGQFHFITLSKMADLARGDLSKAKRASAQEENEYQVKREFNAVMGETRNAAQSYYLQEMIPLDRMKVLDLGCGAGYWSARIAKLNPWMRLVGIDVGEPFIQKAKEKYQSDRVQFQVEDFANLSFEEGAFDCIYADNSLEHSYDVDAVLAQSFKVLKKGGVCIAALPSDGRNPKRICDNHTWKTVPHEVKLRFQAAGFEQIEIEEINTRIQLGMPPYAPSKDRMMYVKAWKKPASSFERALQIMDWVYQTIQPGNHIESMDAREIIAHGGALCIGYVIVMGKMLKKEGYDVKWLTMLAQDHPRGRGEKRVDSHEALLVKIDEREMVFDPTANTVIPHSLQAVLKDPELALPKCNPDSRYQKRKYELYDGSFWYRRVFKYAVRNAPEEDHVYNASTKGLS